MLLQPQWHPRSEEDLTWPFSRYWDTNLSTLKAAQVFDLQTYLPEDILTKVDRTSMHWGVEARVPLLSRRMVEFALRTSTAVHRRRGRRKNVLKRGLEGRVPALLLSDRKKGFGLPLELTVGPMLRRWLGGAQRSAIVRDGLVSSTMLHELSDSLDKAWALFALECWWSRWVRRSGSSSGS